MIIRAEEFDYKWFQNIPVEEKKGRVTLRNNERDFKDIICAFDIETTRYSFLDGKHISKRAIKKLSSADKKRVEYQSKMYVWQFQFGDKYTVMGRTWREFLEFAKRLSECLGVSKRLMIYVHNLSFEFQFLRGIYDFQADDIFAIDRRHIIKCTMFDCLEFRCSYKLTNMSLAQFTKKMGVKHEKLSGTFDYEKMRSEKTPLTDTEVAYCVHDVLGLVEAVKILKESENDTLQSIPLTSTGYVRRDCKKAMHRYRNLIQDIYPDLELYDVEREAFRGGDNHASRFYSNVLIDDVKSKDISSSYPYVMTNCRFPMRKFFHVKEPITLETVHELIDRRDKAVLIRVAITNLRLADEYFPAPYFSKSKCRDVTNAQIDNGRILKADYLETTLTDVDLEIVEKEYAWDDFVILDCFHSTYGYLPKELRSVVNHYYEVKTSMKDVPGEEVYYMKTKNKLNGIYGMSAQNPIRDTYKYDGWNFEIDDSESREELLLNSKKSAFFVYQWAVWVTAWARYRLHQGIWAVGDDFVYCDTDSVKYVGDHDADFEELIRDAKESSKKNGSFATDPSGKTHYMGVYEDDGVYGKFKTLGAKKYAYSYPDSDEIHITIAGVTKSEGGKELMKHKGFDSFAIGFTFIEAGGKDIVYQDNKEEVYRTYRRQKIGFTSNCSVVDSTYTLSLTDDYQKLLSNSILYLKYKENSSIIKTGTKIKR